MSHIVTIETQIRDIQALRAACRRLELNEPVIETVKLFRTVETGYCVRLPQWRYPVVCKTEAGQILYDNYEGRWGEQSHLDGMLQAYAIEKSKIEAQKQGHTIYEQPLADGSVKLTIELGGAA